jgi:REP element-mobilizing transposase RayT
MPRPLRIEYAGACYHVMSRGDGREAIVVNDKDRTEFLVTLGQACQKTGWQVHAYCLMTNHFHLVVETPQPNLGLGMKWLLGTYTQRFNRRHRHWGHLFGGRYKAQLIDERSAAYLKQACDYVHLNPVRARIIRAKDKLDSFPWSSYPAYRHPKLRPRWLRVDRLLGEHVCRGIPPQLAENLSGEWRMLGQSRRLQIRRQCAAAGKSERRISVTGWPINWRDVEGRGNERGNAQRLTKPGRKQSWPKRSRQSDGEKSTLRPHRKAITPRLQ